MNKDKIPDLLFNFGYGTELFFAVYQSDLSKGHFILEYYLEAPSEYTTIWLSAVVRKDALRQFINGQVSANELFTELSLHEDIVQYKHNHLDHGSKPVRTIMQNRFMEDSLYMMPKNWSVKFNYYPTINLNHLNIAIEAIGMPKTVEVVHTKQVIVVRKDLNMRKGKIAAQVAHASMKVFFDRQVDYDPGEMKIELTEAMQHWVDNAFTKICVSVNSEAELDAIYEKAIEFGIPAAMIVDSGRTEFNGVPTKTCVAIGPDHVANVDKVTSGLPLL